METRKEQKHEPKARQTRKQEPRPRLQIVKLEQRIAPGFALNHNETLVRDPATARPRAAEARRREPKPRLQIIKLEQRIAPGFAVNHNETLVRDRSRRAAR